MMSNLYIRVYFVNREVSSTFICSKSIHVPSFAIGKFELHSLVFYSYSKQVVGLSRVWSCCQGTCCLA